MNDFQQLIDQAVAPFPIRGVEDEIHATPVPDEGIVEYQEPEMLAYAKKNRALKQVRVNNVHVGVAGFFNLAYAAQARVGHLLLVDVNKNQPYFWKEIVSILAKEETPQAFRAAFESRIIEGKFHFTDTAPDKAPIAVKADHWDLEEYMEHAQSQWLEPKAYRHLHKLAKNGKIATAVVDVYRDGPKLKAMNEAIGGAGMRVASCYWSNVAQFNLPQKYDYPKASNYGMDEAVFGDSEEGLEYNWGSFSHAPKKAGFQRWNGEERDETGRIIPTQKLPLHERMMRNISQIGDNATAHFLTNTRDSVSPIIFEGPPRNLDYLKTKRSIKFKNVQEGKHGWVL